MVLSAPSGAGRSHGPGKIRATTGVISAIVIGGLALLVTEGSGSGDVTQELNALALLRERLRAGRVSSMADGCDRS